MCVGLTPESLAVAGASRQESAAALAGLAAAHEAREALRESRELHGAAAASLAELDLALSRKPDDAALRSARAQAAAAVEAQRARGAEAARALRAIATDCLSPETAMRLDAWRRAAAFDVPEEFRALDLPEPEWRAVQELVGAERAALRAGAQPSPTATAALAALRDSAQVESARLRLVERLPELRQVFSHAH